MVRNYVRKTDRAEINEEVIKEALQSIIEKRTSIREAAEKYGLKKSTLASRLKVLRKSRNEGKQSQVNQR